MIEKLNKFISPLKARVDLLIVVSSAISSLFLFAFAALTNGIWHEFLINLSASMLAIAITVLLVDKLREHRLSEQYKIPSEYAMKKIEGTNMTLALTLAAKNHKKNPEIVRGMMLSVRDAKEAGASDSMNSSSLQALRQLAELDTDIVVSDFSHKELETTLRNGLRHVRETYIDIQSKYGFSFRDIELKSDYANLLDAVDAAIGSITVIGVGEAEMQKLFKPVDPKKPGKPMTINHFIGISVSGYLKSYIAFIDKHKD